MSSRKYFKKYSPEVALSQTGDIGSSVNFNIDVGKNDTAYPSNGNAFFVFKSTLSAGANTANAPADTYRAWNWPASVITTAREKMNGTIIATVNDFTRTDSILKRNKYSDTYLSTVGQLMALDDDTSRGEDATAFRTVDTIFVPSCLATFNVDKLHPGTNLKIEFDVDNIGYHKKCIKSNADRTHGVGAYYLFNITSIELYILIEENSSDMLKSTTVPYSMIEYKTNMRPINNTEVVHEIIKVEPSVISVMYGLQENNADTNNLISSTDFSTTLYNFLTNQYVTYNGFHYPENMNDCKFEANVQEYGFKLSSFMNLAYNGLLWNGSGYEGYSKFSTERGRFYLYDLEKDASVQATDLSIHMRFSAPQSGSLCTVTSNSFVCTVTYDDFGNMIGTPIKEIL